jgi:hypothetical protein
MGIINNALDHQSKNWQKLNKRFVSQAGGIRVSDSDRQALDSDPDPQHGIKLCKGSEFGSGSTTLN